MTASNATADFFSGSANASLEEISLLFDTEIKAVETAMMTGGAAWGTLNYTRIGQALKRIVAGKATRNDEETAIALLQQIGPKMQTVINEALAKLE